ncbi:MAG: hypothetical protein ACHQ2Y_02775 [Candidatus Lutacidiplasmatales archaeon]
MNRFDREYWDGAREMALMFYESMKSRKDVPEDIKNLAETALRETGERKNRDFRDALGLGGDPPSTEGASGIGGERGNRARRELNASSAHAASGSDPAASRITDAGSSSPRSRPG